MSCHRATGRGSRRSYSCINRWLSNRDNQDKDCINQFKLDGTGNVDSVYPGSQFDSDFAAAIQLIQDIRADKPDTFVNLTTGTWASPFWLKYADSIWRGGYDYNFAGVGPKRERWTTYRDQQTYQNIVIKGPLFPINSLMLHGIIYAQHAVGLNTDPDHDFADEVHFTVTLQPFEVLTLQLVPAKQRNVWCLRLERPLAQPAATVLHRADRQVMGHEEVANARGIVIIGGGIVGLATARALHEDLPDATITVLEAEQKWAAHQSGHNSNVIHSGIYYRPGSMMARLARAGGEAMIRFCTVHNVPVRRTGKLIVATRDTQLAPMAELARRGRANGVTVREITGEEARALEPSVHCVAALDVAETAITDFGAVVRALADELGTSGVTLQLSSRVTSIEARDTGVVVHTAHEAVTASVVVNCAGLHCDEIARMCNVDLGVRIQPFRGEYHRLDQRPGTTVARPIYPVPDPALPFLGVHITPGVDGVVRVGPNAVPAFSRAGYRWRDVDWTTLTAWARDPALRKLARSYWRTGAREIIRSLVKPLLTSGVRHMLPAVNGSDLHADRTGVRAEAIDDEGHMLDDFVIRTSPRAVHVLNAPSPAATASLLIGRHVARLVQQALAD